MWICNNKSYHKCGLHRIVWILFYRLQQNQFEMVSNWEREREKCSCIRSAIGNARISISCFIDENVHSFSLLFWCFHTLLFLPPFHWFDYRDHFQYDFSGEEDAFLPIRFVRCVDVTIVYIGYGIRSNCFFSHLLFDTQNQFHTTHQNRWHSHILTSTLTYCNLTNKCSTTTKNNEITKRK